MFQTLFFFVPPCCKGIIRLAISADEFCSTRTFMYTHIQIVEGKRVHVLYLWPDLKYVGYKQVNYNAPISNMFSTNNNCTCTDSGSFRFTFAMNGKRTEVT